MPKRHDPPEPKRPTISLEDGKRRLERMRDKGKAMLAARPLSESAVETWVNTTIDYIKQTFGEYSDHFITFIGEVRMLPYGDSYEDHREQADAERLEQRIEVLDSLIDVIDTELSFAAPVVTPQQENFWARLHPDVTRAAKTRFDADAVEAAFKDLNSRIKTYVKQATGEEFDGADLMQQSILA